ncbi:MAG: ATP-binding cassette domain-containing protein, partial [Anaerolineae bacterium]|nr:ATP-binding cassette domain-containing protein [Anaerolineae bacterium]
MTTVTFEHVTKRFHQSIEGMSRAITAVDDVTLKLISGDVLAILGPSGCGKSTFLR